jgi:hypothetical protein
LVTWIVVIVVDLPEGLAFCRSDEQQSVYANRFATGCGLARFGKPFQKRERRDREATPF